MSQELYKKVPRLPYNFARMHGVCLESRVDKAVLLYTTDLPPNLLMEIRRFAEASFAVEKVSTIQFENKVAEVYAHENGAAQRIADDAGEVLSLKTIANTVNERGDLFAQEDDAPIIRLINALLMQALRENASDIHFETFENRLVVRLRVDGVLQEVLSLQPSLAPLLVSRIKVMSKLDIAEKRLPQDGRISLRLGGREVDIRVATMPTGQGERVVLRILDKQAGRLHLSELGLPANLIATLRNCIRKPHGIILVTGPTGSGKTTSLYAMLSELNDQTRNILTVEDPVEYQLEGFGQTQVNTKVDLTFARGLRAILRQDPDVVMVGEIRDTETAQIAVQASLTGHLVLSTLHTNSAVGAITRLIDMGIEPFLLSSSLTCVIAQRLVRVLCPDCRREYSADKAECNFLGIDVEKIYKPVGCTSCRNTGFKGRKGIYEVLSINDTIRNMVHNGSAEHDIETYAIESCAHKNMLDDGRSKVLSGMTTIEEIMRVIRD